MRLVLYKYVVIACLVFIASFAMAELTVESVYPNLAKIGEELEVIIAGQGFDQNTRVQMTLDTNNTSAIISSVATLGSTCDVTISGNLAFVAAGSGGLVIIDISDPVVSAIIGQVDISGKADAVALSGPTAYVAAGDGGLQVVDVSDPANPEIIGSVDTSGNADAVFISGSTAYIADGENGLQVIDVSDPENSAIIGWVDTPGYAKDIAISGTRGYVADLEKGLQIIDVAFPNAPTIIGSLDIPGHARGVGVIETTAYVAAGDGGLQVIDVSDPANPAIIGSVTTAGGSWALTLSGDTAYVADGTGGLQVIDVSEPSLPTLIGTINTPGSAQGVALSGSMACVADGYSGYLQIIDLSAPIASAKIGSVDTPHYAQDVAISGAIAYVPDGPSGLQVVDISTPTNPSIIGSIDTPGYAKSVAFSGSMAYVADGYSYVEGEYIGYIQIIDISVPANPVIVGSFDTHSKPNHIAISGDMAYVAAGDRGLLIIDISAPTEPKIISKYTVAGSAVYVSISGSLAYVVYTDGLRIVDISDPKNPTSLSHIKMPTSIINNYLVYQVWASSVTISGTAAYLGTYELSYTWSNSYPPEIIRWRTDTGLRIYDISDPTTPVFISSVDLPGGYGDFYSSSRPSIFSFKDIIISGATAYVPDGEYGMQFIDISNPAAPTIIGSVDTPGSAKSAAISGNTAIVADGTSGLAIISLPEEISSFIVTNDSSLSCTLPAPNIEGNYNLRVFNASESSELTGAVTFLEAIDYQPKEDIKAIIVAGGGDYAGNTLWPSTCLVSNQAYKTLISQGYKKENIWYLGDHRVDLYPEDEIVNDVDAQATSTNLSWAINTWAADASELFLFMTDHGKHETFQLNADEPYFNARELDGWLDSLQETMNGLVVCVYDACNSGSFIPLLKPPPGKERIVIASSKADERAWFMNQGINSFSYQFWSSVYSKGNLFDAFVDAKNMMTRQTCLLDADGDGIATTKQDQIAAGKIIIGRGYSAASLPPVILNVSDNQTLDGDTRATLLASLGTNGLDYIDKVWAVVVPPDLANFSSDIPVTDLASVDLLDTDDDGIFEGQYDGFNQKGTYQVIVYAKDKDDLYSLPMMFTVNQLAGSSPVVDGDYSVTNELWAKAVLEVPGSSVDLAWKMVGADITPSGDQVISGYFYADPEDFAYGSIYNPEIFVKIYIAANGWANIAFNHVTVDPVSVYSAHNYTGSPTQTGSISLTSRLVEHAYTGVAIDNTLQSSGGHSEYSSGAGYALGPDLWAKTVLQPATGPVNLIWKAVGSDTTPSGDRVISGYFYASPDDFPYGSPYNPELFVKIFIAANGWANIAFNHVTVDGVDISSAHNYSGTADQSGTATLSDRLVEHQYDGVGLQ